MNTRRNIPLVAAIVTLLIHLVANPHYGFLRDELYFIICGFHPAWGYVDQAPVVPLLGAGSQFFGHSLFMLRAIPAFFAAASTYTTCLLALDLGGAAFAELFAAVVAVLTPLMMGFGTMLTTEIVGLWLWPLTALYVLRIVNGGDRRWWLAVGAILGVALESKYSALLFAVAVVGGLALVPQRRVLLTRWFAYGLLVAALIALPNMIWQAVHGYPTITLLRDASDYKNVALSAPFYVGAQVLITNPLLAPVWLIGLVSLLMRSRARFLGIAYVILIAEMIVLHGKHYYPGNYYPILIAAGAVTIERWTTRAAPLRPALTLYALLTGSILVPFLMPVLPEPAMAAYAGVIARIVGRGVDLARTDRSQLSDLPPDWADMHGWEELTATVARVYDSLPPAERGRAAIFASNYGEAAAIDFFGAQYHLPPVIAAHNQYWLWGTRGYTGNVIVDVHGRCEFDVDGFRVRRIEARFSNRWVRPFENDFPISVCEGITTPLSTIWPKLRTYI